MVDRGTVLVTITDLASKDNKMTLFLEVWVHTDWICQTFRAVNIAGLVLSIVGFTKNLGNLSSALWAVFCAWMGKSVGQGIQEQWIQRCCVGNKLEQKAPSRIEQADKEWDVWTVEILNKAGVSSVGWLLCSVLLGPLLASISSPNEFSWNTFMCKQICNSL